MTDTDAHTHAHAHAHALDYLDILPSAAPEVLRWLLEAGPLTFDQLTERRRARLAAQLGDHLPPAYPAHSLLYDLHALDLLAFYSPQTRAFHLNPSAAEAVRAHVRAVDAETTKRTPTTTRPSPPNRPPNDPHLSGSQGGELHNA